MHLALPSSHAVTVGDTQRACRVRNRRMRLPGGRQAQVVRGHDRGEREAQAPFQAEWISRIPYQPGKNGCPVRGSRATRSGAAPRFVASMSGGLPATHAESSFDS